MVIVFGDEAMSDKASTTRAKFDRSLLYAAELQHRTNNEYASVISLVSRLAALSTALETKNALFKVIDYLHAASRVQQALRPPIPGETVEFTGRVEQLCKAFASAVPKERSINLHLTTSGSAILDAMRAWRASLIISELITNSVRHACIKDGSRIRVAVATSGAEIACQVSDNGTPVAVAKPGVGSYLIDDLAEELDACVIRSFTELGAVITFSFPAKPESN